MRFVLLVRCRISRIASLAFYLLRVVSRTLYNLCSICYVYCLAHCMFCVLFVTCNISRTVCSVFLLRVLSRALFVLCYVCYVQYLVHCMFCVLFITSSILHTVCSVLHFLRVISRALFCSVFYLLRVVCHALFVLCCICYV